MPVEAQFMTRPAQEISVSRSGVSLCLLIHQKNRALRIIDFRAGASDLKREVIYDVARQHGIERVFTLVERDEVTAWQRLGFRKEGSIVGFYKRTDAYVLGANVPSAAAPSNHSGIRRAFSREPDPKNPTEVHYQAALRSARELAVEGHLRIKVQPAPRVEVERAVTTATRNARALTSFEPFSRDVEKRFYSCTARGGFSLMVGVEVQTCFDNVFVELLTAPRSDKETRATVLALARILELLTEQGIVGCFAASPVHQVHLNAAYLASGFRRTGNLKGHLLSDGFRRDAFLWSQRLAQPGDD